MSQPETEHHATARVRAFHAPSPGVRSRRASSRRHPPKM